jgi:hypothetical protein
MSTASKTPASIRQGGPGASHENAKAPLDVRKPPPAPEPRHRSTVSGGGGEADSHHTHDAEKKGGGTRPAGQQPRR